MHLFHFFFLKKIGVNQSYIDRLSLNISPVFRNRAVFYCIFLIFMMLPLNGCGRMIVNLNKPLFEDLSNSFMQQEDIVLAEQGIPAYLLFLDGLIKHNPNDSALLLKGASAYSAYASAFVKEKNPERNRMLTAKAKDYAFRALSRRNRKFDRVKDAPHAEFVKSLRSYLIEDVPFMYYAATTWAGWIQANSESYDALADIPKVQSLIGRVIELDGRFHYGAPHTFMGVMLSLRPPSLGGKPDEAKKHFEKAIDIGGGKFLPAYLMYADYYAKPLYEKELFYNLLRKVQDSPADTVPELTLINRVAQKQAGKLIEEVRREDYFD